MAGLADTTKRALDTASNPAKDAGPKEMAIAGVALAALPIAIEQIAKRVAPKLSNVGDEAKDKVSDAASQVTKDVAIPKLKQQGPAGKAMASAAGGGILSKLIPGSSGGDEDDQGDGGGGLLSKLAPGSSGDDGEEGRAAPGHGGSGRRMPIQQSVDVAVPVKVAYNRFTMFEDWPKFMHRVESVDQEDDNKLAVSAKVWGITRRFEAEILEQRPDERIEWNVTEGIAHTGVVTFHPLAKRLTRIEVSLDIEPQGMLEKMGRGMRFAKRAVRADLHRFKALVELDEEAEGGWRGTIEGGEVKRRSSSNGSGPAKKSRSRSRSSTSKKSSRSRSTRSAGTSSRSGKGKQSASRSKAKSKSGSRS